MPKSTSDSFVLSLSIKTNPHEEKVLDTRLNAAGLLYNAVLGTCLDKLDLIRQSKNWRKAIKLHIKPNPLKNEKKAAKE